MSEADEDAFADFDRRAGAALRKLLMIPAPLYQEVHIVRKPDCFQAHVTVGSDAAAAQTAWGQGHVMAFVLEETLREAEALAERTERMAAALKGEAWQNVVAAALTRGAG